MFWTCTVVILLFIESVFFTWFLVAKFCNEYEHCQHRIDGYRIPLWYPYGIYGDSSFTSVALDDWRLGREDGVELVSFNPEKQFSLLAANDFRDALHFLTDIVDFHVSTNVVCGLREVRPYRGCLHDENKSAPVTCYFLFATNMTSFLYFEDEKTYLQNCALYGVDGRKRKNFKAHFDDFCSRREEQRTIDNLLDNLVRNPLSKGERNGLILLMIVPFTICLGVSWIGWNRRCKKERKRNVPIQR